MANKKRGTKVAPARKKLRDGEFYNNGRYEYHYVDNSGRRRVVSSSRLDKTDALPKGKRMTLSLREREALIEDKLTHDISIDDSKTLFKDVVRQFLDVLYTRKKLSESTITGYERVYTDICNNRLGQLEIGSIKASDADRWLVEMRKHYKGSSIQSSTTVIKRTFEFAIDRQMCIRNPFRTLTVSRDDSDPQIPLTASQRDNYLDYVRDSKSYQYVYPIAYTLFWTGLRASELCGVTIDDVDFKNHVINVNKQLKGNHKLSLSLKTDAAYRQIPMTDELESVLQTYLTERWLRRGEPVIYDDDGKAYTGFLFLTYRSRKPLCRNDIEAYIRHSIDAYNRDHEEEPLRVFRPHICRHTFATEMAKKMNPTFLKRILGHTSVITTYQYYTHINEASDLKAEIDRVISEK